MARAAARLVCLRPTDLNYRRVIARRTPFHEALVPAGRRSAQHADGVKLVHDLRDCHELGHGAKRLAAKVRVGTRDYDPTTSRREGRRELHDRIIEELRFVDRDHLRHRIQGLRDLRGRIHRHRLDAAAVMAGDRVNPRITTVEM